MPRRRISPRKSSSSNQCLLAWLAIVLAKQPELLLDERLVERDEDVRTAEIAVVLRDLVLEDQVVAERVPRELAGEPVVLVEVVPRVREDEIRLDRPSASRTRP